ncbi:MAG TPA: S53 family peptidase, partial [Mycobacteriales bacterium]
QYTESLPDNFVTDPNCEPPSKWAVEEAIDVEAVHTAAPAAAITYVGARSCLDLFTGLNDAVDRRLGSIVSNSWGFHGEDVTTATRRQADSIFVQAALTGISVVFSAGDVGDNQGNPTNGQPQPDWPASSPWVTAVGGTSTGLDADDGLLFETGWESQVDSLDADTWVAMPPPAGPFGGGSGGGPSHVYSEPSWQGSVVPDELSGGHRTVPDIAALADPHTGFAIGLSVNGVFSVGATGGTSVACPLIAAIFADAEQIQGVPLGLATPALYRLAGGSGLRDVTDVHAAVYSAHGPAAVGDFLWETDRRTQTLQAGPGFDPVTGLGVPSQAFLSRFGH